MTDRIKTDRGYRYPTLSGRDVITVFIYPPIPDRSNDWCAYRDGDEEQPGLVGWGATEMEALMDLRECHRMGWDEASND